MVLPILGDHQKGQIDLLRVLYSNNAILMLTISDLKWHKFEMIREQIELHLPHPDPVEHCLILVF